MTAIAVLPRLFRPYLGLELISEELQTRLVNRIVKDHELTEEEATDILDAALGFLKLCADYPGHGFSPSRKVDIGWHTFLMYTRDYADLCERIAGHFIHHEPNDRPGEANSPVASGQIGGSRGTVMFMREHGIAFSPALWGVVQGAGDCEHHCAPPRGETERADCACNTQGSCAPLPTPSSTRKCCAGCSAGAPRCLSAAENAKECHGCGTGKPGPVTAVVAEDSRECVDPCYGESTRCRSDEPEPHKRSTTGN